MSLHPSAYINKCLIFVLFCFCTANTIPSKSLISLDDKIAQIAGNLSIYDSYSSTQAGRIYRAPDGSLSTINWSGTMPCVQVSTVSNQQMSQVSIIHQSPSLNQIIGPVNTNHQPTASIPLNPTNPWAASAQSNVSSFSSRCAFNLK